MDKDKSGKLGDFLREVSNWRWDDFWRAERDSTYTSNESIIFALIRNCAMENLAAIKLTLNRLDGKLKTPIRIETPKVYYLFPNAKLAAMPPGKSARHELVGDKSDAAAPNETVSGEVIPTESPPEPEVNELPSLSLRQTLTKMSDYPRNVPKDLAYRAERVEEALREKIPIPAEIQVPMVKSVVAAHLLIMAQARNIEALTEVFDQIDGKLAETIQIIGEDIYITSYATTAPVEAVLNDDGVLQVAAEQSQAMWAAKLGVR